MKFIYLFIAANLLLFGNACAQNTDHASDYAGQEEREITTLSEEDIQELKEGQGWGLAKPAELNGVPGPRHVLDMGEELNLTEAQVASIQAIFDEMKSGAIEWGEKYIEAERELDIYFESGELNQDSLRSKVMTATHSFFELRMVHLASHLETAEILTEEQIQTYNDLRGYSTGTDPCENIPEGHDEELWKRHNNCN